MRPGRRDGIRPGRSRGRGTGLSVVLKAQIILLSLPLQGLLAFPIDKLMTKLKPLTFGTGGIARVYNLFTLSWDHSSNRPNGQAPGWISLYEVELAGSDHGLLPDKSRMITLYHHPLCPHSRFVRLLLGEYDIKPELIEEKPFERRRDFLILDPAGQTPVLVEQSGMVLSSPGPIAEYFDETRGLTLGRHRLLPEDPASRAEVRRLFDWFAQKFFHEVTNWLVTEKVYKRFMSREQGGGRGPDMELVHAARVNIRTHLRYIGYLASHRNWLAGDRLSHADLAAAAHLSCVDFLGDVPWDENETAKNWYARIKSRPSFRTLLADRVPGLFPSPVYADLDF